MDFGGHIAYKGCDAQPGKSSDGEKKMAKKKLKKSKKIQATKPLLVHTGFAKK